MGASGGKCPLAKRWWLMLWPNEDLEIHPSRNNSGTDLPTTFGDTFNAAWSTQSAIRAKLSRRVRPHGGARRLPCQDQNHDRRRYRRRARLIGLATVPKPFSSRQVLAKIRQYLS